MIEIKCDRDVYLTVLENLSNCWYINTPTFYKYYLENIIKIAKPA